MRLLALDLGTRRTGAAFYDSRAGFPVALDTISHTTIDELLVTVRTLLTQRTIDRIILGLPLLPSGEEGSQAAFVRDIAQRLQLAGCNVAFVDERHTTPRSSHPRKAHHGPPASSFDGDSAAAILLLQGYLDRVQEK